MGILRIKKMEAIFLCAIFAITSLFNISKAVHIDDPVYIETGRSLMQDLGHPLSTQMNWNEIAEPLHSNNQPILLPALLALCTTIFGNSLFSMHLLMLLFNALSIVLSFRIAARLSKKPLFYIILFAMSPAFILGQNLMTDLPCLSFWLLFFDALLGRGNRGGGYALAACAASLACLTKYVSLALFPVLIIIILFDRSWENLWVMCIPCCVLAFWSLYNLSDYGGIHLLRFCVANTDPLYVLRKLLDWVFGLGAFLPLSVACMPYLYRKRMLWVVVTILGLVLFALRRIFLFESAIQSVAATLCGFSGLLIVLTLILFARDTFKAIGRSDVEIDRDRMILWIWLAAGGIFIVMLAPFMASRHILLILPPVIILLCEAIFPVVSRPWITAGSVLTVCLGCLLGIADWQWAQVYPTSIPTILAKSDGPGTVWFTGHWGWQWYAAAAGMRQYDTSAFETPRPGDRFVIPRNVVRQTITDQDCRALTAIDSVVVPASALTLLRPMFGIHGAFAFSVFNAPWIITRDPLEVFTIFRYEPGTNDPGAATSGLCKPFVRTAVRFVNQP
jgi:hypothetical protein